MPRKNVKLIKRSKADWSHETTGINVDFPSTLTNGLYQAGSVVVPPVTTQGKRTVGNFTVTVPVFNSETAIIYWALILVPQGTSANGLFSTSGTISSGSLYEPNQFVIASGLVDSNAGPIRIKSRMKRTLQSGDQISLVLGTTASASLGRGLVSYSIKYN